jgi:hypothetical protein
MVAATVIGLVSLREGAVRRAGEDARAPLSALPAASQVTEAPPPAQVPPAPPTGVPTPTVPSAASGEGAQPGVAASARPRRPGTLRGADTVVPSAAASRPRSAPDPCDPPYTLDEAGRKHFKLSCVN